MISVTVNGIDRSSEIEWKSLKVQQAISSQPDKCSFTVNFNGTTKTWEPANGDIVLVTDSVSGDNIFGGIVIRVDREVIARELIAISVECTSYEKDLDRYLVVDSYEDVSAYYVINSIIDDYVNRDHVVLFFGPESWTDEVGTSSIDTVNKVFGEQARTFSVPTGVTVSGRVPYSPVKDLDVYDNLRTGSDADKLTGWVKITGPIASVRVRLVTDVGATYTNYLEKTFTDLRQGWQQLVVVESDMTEVGTFDRNSVAKLQLAATATADGEVTFSDWRVINELGYTQQAVVGADTTIDYARFNYEPVSAAIRQVVDNLNFEWYIDSDRDIHIFAPADEGAPFGLTDDNGMYNYDSLSLEANRDSLRNQIYVRGGNEIGATQDEDLSYQIDGTNVIFQMGYGYANISVTLNGTPQTIGIENVVDPTSVDVLYNFAEKTLRFPSALTPGDALIVTGQPYLPVIIKKRDVASITEYGVYEFLIIDKTINSRAAARQRAQAELNTYRADIKEGSFKTYQSGLHVGQSIAIQSTIRGIDDTFIISRLSMSMHTPEDPVYTATIVSTKTYGIIEFLIDLLRRDNKQITIGGDEVIDVVETYEEEILVGETISISAPYTFPETITAADADANYIDDPPTWVAAPYHPTSLLLDRKRPMFADRSNVLKY